MRLPADDARRRAVTILNPIGEDLSVMRTFLAPSLLADVVRNVRRGNDAGALFELANVYLPGQLPLTELPEERKHLALAKWGEGDFFDVKGAVEAFAEAFGLRLTFEKGEEPFLHPGITAVVRCGERQVGVIGELHPAVAAGLALVRGFFREHWMPKVCVGIGVYLVFVISQIRFSIITMFSTLACSIFLCGILVVLVLEMRRSVRDMLPPEIRVPAKAETQSEIFLADYELSQRDLYALYAVLHGQTYPVIGDKLYCSTSTIKQIMRRIYQQFGVSDRSHFVELLSQYKIVPPEWYRVPEEFSRPVPPAAAQTDSAD